MDKKLRTKAEARVEAKHGFYVVAAVFASVSTILFIISQNFAGPAAYWIKFPILILGLVLGIIYVSMFGISLNQPFNSDWKEEEIQKEMAILSLERKFKMGVDSQAVLDDEDIDSEMIHYEAWNG